jgi:hypothetical protein
MSKPTSQGQVEKIWPLYYGKAKMPCSKLIVKEFAFKILADKQGKNVS